MFGMHDPKPKQGPTWGTYTERFNKSITYSDIGMPFFETDTGNAYIVAPSTVTFNKVAWVPFGGAGNANGGFVQAQQVGQTTTQLYFPFGDSYINGTHTPPTSNSFAYLTAVRLAVTYPGTTQANGGNDGDNSTDMLSRAAGYVTAIPGYGFGSMTFGLMMVGINNLREPWAAKYSLNTGPACCQNDTFATAITSRHTDEYYKQDLKNTINTYLTAYPNARIVVCTILDPSNNGLGPDTEFAAWTDYQVILARYNQRVKEVANEMNLPLADTYSALLGHPSWFDSTDKLHPNAQGDFTAALVIERAYASFMGGAAGGSLDGNMPTPLSFSRNTPINSFRIPANCSITYARKLTLNSGVIMTLDSNAVDLVI